MRIEKVNNRYQVIDKGISRKDTVVYPPRLINNKKEFVFEITKEGFSTQRIISAPSLKSATRRLRQAYTELNKDSK